MTTRQTPDASPYVAGPIWAEPEDDCFTTEIQTVGGHSVIATVHGNTRDEAEQRQLAILAALDSRAGDAGEGWQSIETAPRDGTWFIADGGGLDRPTPMKWCKRVGAWEADAVMLEDWDQQAEGYSRPLFWIAIPDRRSPTTAPAVDAEEGDDGGPCTDCCDTGITIQTERTCSCDAGDQYRAPAVDAVPAGEVSLRDALDDAINSPKGVVPVSAEPFYDGRAGRVKPAEAAPTAYLMTGRWELDPEGKTPGIYMDDPEGGDPICLCAIKRVYHPGLLSAALSHGEVQA